MTECMKATRIAEDNVAGLEGKQLGKVHLNKGWKLCIIE